MPRNSATSMRRAAAVAAATALGASLMVASTAQADPQVTQADVERAFHRAEAANEAVNELVEEQKTLDRRIDEISAEIASISKVHRVQKEELGAAIVQQHLEQPLGPTVSLLASQDSDVFIRGLSAIDALNTTRADALVSFTRTRESLDKRQKQLDDHRETLAKSKADAEKHRATMQEQHRKAQADLARLNAATQAAMNSSNTKAVANAGSGAAKAAIAFAMKQLGDRYVYGGTGPNGWDCSGLVMKSYAAAGVSLPRVVGPQINAGRRISRADLKPGDLVAYGSMSHIGIYLGGGKVIHAPRPGKTVEITGMSRFTVFSRVAG